MIQLHYLSSFSGENIHKTVDERYTKVSKNNFPHNPDIHRDTFQMHFPG